MAKPDAIKADSSGLSSGGVQAAQQKPFETVPCCSLKAATRVIKRCRKGSIPPKKFSVYTDALAL